MPITVSAVVIRDDLGRVLTVRKRGTARFMFPGGKPEPGETAAETALRECAEEIGLHLDPAGLTLLGIFSAPAANEAGEEVLATVYEHSATAATAPAAEIEELRWSPVDSTTDDLAPLLREQVFPILRGAATTTAAARSEGERHV
jgi:8-oxo-dGTP pyrophosphatase MutT (NUDIX family)